MLYKDNCQNFILHSFISHLLSNTIHSVEAMEALILCPARNHLLIKYPFVRSLKLQRRVLIFPSCLSLLVAKLPIIELIVTPIAHPKSIISSLGMSTLKCQLLAAFLIIAVFAHTFGVVQPLEVVAPQVMPFLVSDFVFFLQSRTINVSGHRKRRSGLRPIF